MCDNIGAFKLTHSFWWAIALLVLIYQLDKVPGRGRETTNKSHVGALRFPDPLNFYRGTWLVLMLSVPMWDSSSKILSIHRALAEKQALMVVAAAEAQKRMMETSTNGAKRGGCCNKCWNTATQMLNNLKVKNTCCNKCWRGNFAKNKNQNKDGGGGIRGSKEYGGDLDQRGQEGRLL